MKRLLAIIAVLTFSLAASGASSGDHRGRILLNPSRPNTDVFINYMKSCQNWRVARPYAFPNILNSDGYPQSAPAVGLTCYIGFADGSTGALTPGYKGNWIVSWKGTFGAGGVPGVRISGPSYGAFAVARDPGHCAVGGKSGLMLTGTNCTVTFSAAPSLTKGRFIFTFLGNPSSGLRNITRIDLYREDQAALFKNGKIFNPEYILYLKALNPRVLRFLNWSYISWGNRSRFYDETPTTAMSWNLDTWDKNAWVGAIGRPGCTSSDNGASYTAPAPKTWSGLVDGAFIQCEVSTANMPHATLNVAGTGAVPIVTAAYLIPVRANNIKAHKLVTFLYSKQLNGWMVWKRGHTYAVPTIAEVQLCNTLNADCWIQIPTYFDTASAQALAAVVAKNMKPDLKAYFEYSNELFLTFTPQGFYASAMGRSMKFPNTEFGNRAEYSFAGLRSKQMFDAIKAIWPASNKPEFNGVQTSQIASTLSKAFQKYKLDGVDLTFSAIDAASNTATYCNGKGCTTSTDYTRPPHRPVDGLTTISIGTYVGPPNMLSSSPAPTFVNPRACANNFRKTGNCPYTTLERTPATITNISGSTVTVTAGNVASWSNGDRIHLTGNFGIARLLNSWTTVNNLKRAGDGRYTFTLSSNPPTTDDSGNPIANGGYSGYANGGQATRVLPGLNDALLKAAEQWAAGKRADAFNWASADMYNGTRATNRGGNLTISNYVNIWVAALSKTAEAYPGIGIILYEGGYEAIPIPTVNGKTLGWSAAQTKAVQDFFTAYKYSDQFRDTMLQFFQKLAALPRFKYPAQFNDLGIPKSQWIMTPTRNVKNYKSGFGSYSVFGAIQKFNEMQ